MESDNFSEKKNNIDEEIDFYSRALQLELEQKVELLKKALIIGGVITAGYAITKAFLADSEAENTEVEVDETPRKGSFLGNIAKGMITTLVLNVAKKEISKFVEDRNFK